MATINASMNMVVGGNPATSGTANIPLYMSAVSSGVTGADTGFITGYVSGDPASGWMMNMFVEGGSLGTRSHSGYLNLYVGGQGTSVTQGLDLHITGASEGGGSGTYFSSYVPLTITGQGLSSVAGNIPVSGTMNLYLQGAPQATNSLNLYVGGETGGMSNMDMYIFGVEGISSGTLNLYMPVVGQLNKTLKLFTRGYNAS